VDEGDRRGGKKMSPEAFTRFVETEIGRWGPIAKQVVKQ
jgi:hypothetical protein